LPVKEAVPQVVAAVGAMKMNMMRVMMKSMTKTRSRESATGTRMKTTIKVMKMKMSMRIRVMRMKMSTKKMKIGKMRKMTEGEEAAVVEEVHLPVAEGLPLVAAE